MLTASKIITVSVKTCIACITSQILKKYFLSTSSLVNLVEGNSLHLSFFNNVGRILGGFPVSRIPDMGSENITPSRREGLVLKSLCSDKNLPWDTLILTTWHITLSLILLVNACKWPKFWGQKVLRFAEFYLVSREKFCGFFYHHLYTTFANFQFSNSTKQLHRLSYTRFCKSFVYYVKCSWDCH